MPTRWPCENAIDCPCADGNPLGNFSSEAPDPFTFFARRFFPIPIPGLDDPPQVFIADGCGRVCTSTVSQADADACALRAATECTQPPPPGEPDDPVLFGNRAVACQAECPEGPPFILNIAPGTYLARTQELADAIALSFCQADVIEFRHCEMPQPVPPSVVCPHIISQTSSPINANDGDNVTMTVNYTYNSSMMLMFVWFKDGIATYTTFSSSLTLLAVGPGDAGDYILGIYASGCFPVFSSPITLNVTSSCPPEIGPAAPTTLDIAHPVEWETWTLTAGQIFVTVSAGPCNPTGLYYGTPTTQLDKSPGTYGWKWMAGLWRVPFLDCSGISLDFEDLAVGLHNEEHNIDKPVNCADTSLAYTAGSYSTMAGDPPPSGTFANFAGCFPDVATAHASAVPYYGTTSVGMCIPYPPDNIFQFKHTNTGGNMSLDFFSYGLPGGESVQETYSVKILQVDGQIPQPRKLQIDNFGVIAADFTDPAIGANWNGSFPTRTTFTSAAVLWSAAASGGFGGATVEWINNHPTSANGFGWKLKVFGAGPTLVWQGLKAIDSTSEGRYYKDTTVNPIGPDCCTISDASTSQWFP